MKKKYAGLVFAIHNQTLCKSKNQVLNILTKNANMICVKDAYLTEIVIAAIHHHSYRMVIVSAQLVNMEQTQIHANVFPSYIQACLISCYSCNDGSTCTSCDDSNTNR